MSQELYARKCDNSGVGMNDGFHDAGCYYATEADLLAANRRDNPDYSMSDWEKDCDENEDVCYYTEWDVDEDGWEGGVFTADGTYVPNPNYPDEFDGDE